jgi:hypothetical protein
MSSCTESLGRGFAKNEPALGRATRRPSFVRRLLADTRGTATTETVIMIPMFAIVWGCIFFVFTFFQRTITMRSLTRAHTWAYSYVGCSGTGPGTTLEQVGAGLLGGGGSSNDSDVDSIISSLYALRSGHGTRQSSVARPRVIGGGSLSLSDGYWVMCNDVPRGVADYFGQFVGRLLGFGG